MRKWKGTDEQHQLELMKFYKDLQEIKEKTKREEEKMLKAKTGVSVISIHGSDEELGKDLKDEIMSEGRGSEASLRPSLRPPVSGDRRGLQSRWILACLNPDESKSYEIDSKKEDSNIPKQVGLMEGRRVVSTLEMETSVEDSLEAEAKERPKRETRAETTQVEKAKGDQGEEEEAGGKGGATGEEEAGGKGGTAGGEGKSRSMPDRRKATMAPRIIASGTKEIQAKRYSAITAPKNTLGWQEVGELQILPKKEGDEGAIPAVPSCATLSSASSPTLTLCAPCGLQQRRVRAGSERPCSRNRARSQDTVQQGQHDADTAEVRRGLSLR